MKMIKQLFLLIILAMSTTALAEHNSMLHKKTVELKKLKRQILHIKKSLNKKQQYRKDLLLSLQKLEITIGKKSRHIVKLEAQLRQEKANIAALTIKKKQHIEKLKAQQQILTAQIRAAYMLGQHSYLRLLLNQQDPEKLNRMGTYYGYLNKARATIIADLQQTLTIIAQDQQALRLHQQSLLRLHHQQKIQRHDLNTQLTARRQVITKLDTSIHSQHDRLNTLREDKTALEQLLTQIQKQEQQAKLNAIPFSKMRHHLKLPTQGKIRAHFDNKIANSSLSYNGIVISAPTGQDVHAVYSGKVVFANWLRGVGLLIIIDHGDGYMTLYGHNHSLMKHAGDSVTSGETIATVGASGGYEKSGLYFQIRDKGKPLNPEHWLT